MPNPNISQTISDANKATIAAMPASILAILNFLVNLTPAKRKSLRKMATKRTGYVMAVFAAVIANANAIPLTFDISEYKKDVQLFQDLTNFLNLFRPVVEGMEDTMLMLGNEMMTQSDSCYDFLKRAAKDNEPLTKTVEEIATAYKRKAPAKPATYTIAPNGSVVVEKVLAGTRLVNNGTTVIRFRSGGNKETKIGQEGIVVEPGNSAEIPKGYTTITVANDSGSVDGSFSVRQTK